MSLKTFAAVLCATVGFCATAIAQPTISFGTEPAPIGLNDCADRLNDVITLTGAANVDSDNGFVMRLVMFNAEDSTSADECLDMVTGCPQTYITETAACGCIAEGDDRQQTLNSTLNSGIAGLNPAGTTANNELVNFLCASDGSIQFRADIRGVEPADGSMAVAEQDAESDTISIVIDITPPPALSVDPTVTAAENALVVTIDNADRGVEDIEAHEVCVQIAGTTSSAESASNDLDALRNGFSASGCKRTTQLKNGDEYRYENLNNDVEYALIVAAFDAAGNRSENSTIIKASPSDLMDFAELYTARLGGAVGDTGGCNTHGESTTQWLLGLLLLGGAFIRRRPSK